MYNQPQQKQVQVKINDDALKGIYANNMMVSHSKEEFVLDFISLFGNQGIVTSRIITSPGHLKRIIRALQENLGKYEDAFGEIKESESPNKEIGFGERVENN